ncbi:F0F1 ATP synthase subunit epsilon [bacterium]|jgi:F-type H+-transporting ATPase subunit epsilon|nr:F0F1 ATP synthase subunit epsilon [bacterium]
MAENSKLHCVVVTPERAMVDQDSDSLVIPLFDGEMGILPNRAALVSKLGFGCLRVRSGSTDSLFFIEGGTVQISNNTVTLLTPRATELAALDLASAKALLDSNLEGKSSAERSKSKDRARAILRAGAKLNRR